MTTNTANRTNTNFAGSFRQTTVGRSQRVTTATNTTTIHLGVDIHSSTSIHPSLYPSSSISIIIITINNINHNDNIHHQKQHTRRALI
jgi:hypothetical protein